MKQPSVVSCQPSVGLACLVALALAGGGCSSAPTSVPDAAPEMTPKVDLGPPPFSAAATGWASVPDLGLMTTTGGDGGEVVEVTTTADFAAQAKLAGPRIILVNGIVGEGTRVSITSNHTIIGLPGAEFHGGLKISGQNNVIIRNLKIVGNNCADSPDDCSGGADAVSIGDNSHHVWVDHCDISDGSDGNLDVNDGSDYVTISWTKFSYSGQRAGGHQFSNLVGSSDSEPGDAGHLRVTYHHDWWADNVDERMPRVRYGQVHLLNNLYTASGNNYCVGLGFFAPLLEMCIAHQRHALVRIVGRDRVGASARNGIGTCIFRRRAGRQDHCMWHGQLVDEFGIRLGDIDRDHTSGLVSCNAALQRTALGVGKTFVGPDNACIECA